MCVCLLDSEIGLTNTKSALYLGNTSVWLTHGGMLWCILAVSVITSRLSWCHSRQNDTISKQKQLVNNLTRKTM